MSTNTISQTLDDVSQKNITLIRGNFEIYRSTVKAKNYTTRVKEPFDLTGILDIEMVIENKDTGDIYTTVNKTSGEITVEDAINGKFRVEIPKDITDTIPVGVWWYHVNIIVDSDITRTAVLGKIRVVDD